MLPLNSNSLYTINLVHRIWRICLRKNIKNYIYTQQWPQSLLTRCQEVREDCLCVAVASSPQPWEKMFGREYHLHCKKFLTRALWTQLSLWWVPSKYPLRACPPGHRFKGKNWNRLLIPPTEDLPLKNALTTGHQKRSLWVRISSYGKTSIMPNIAKFIFTKSTILNFHYHLFSQFRHFSHTTFQQVGWIPSEKRDLAMGQQLLLLLHFFAARIKSKWPWSGSLFKETILDCYLPTLLKTYVHVSSVYISCH